MDVVEQSGKDDTQAVVTSEPVVPDNNSDDPIPVDGKTDNQSQEDAVAPLEKDNRTNNHSDCQELGTNSSELSQQNGSQKDKSEDKKPDQTDTPNSDKQVTPPTDKKDNQRALKISSKSIQYTSIVWTLQEAGIISSSNDQEVTDAENDNAKCTDNVHCNGSSENEKMKRALELLTMLVMNHQLYRPVVVVIILKAQMIDCLET